MTVGELIKDYKLVILGILATGGLLVFSVLALFIYVRTGCGENLDQSGEQFARQAIETITSWDHKAVLELMPPPAREQANLVSSLKNSCSTHRVQLGPRTEPVETEGQASARFNLNQKAFATATYSSRCTFKYGKATVSIDLYKDLKISGRNGPWFLLGIRFTGVGE